MIGSIAGDIVGSVYEYSPIKTKDFPLFSESSKYTDDTVLTVATAECLLDNKEYSKLYREYGRRFPNRGYGDKFYRWIYFDEMGAYNSFGNGSAMRVGPVGFVFHTIEETINEAKRTSEVTHNHPEGIKGAQAVASAIFYARNNYSKDEIKRSIEGCFGYDLGSSLYDIRENFDYEEACQITVIQALTAFLESTDFEDALRNAVSLGGDADTIACITGTIAEAFYKNIPQYIIDKTKEALDKDLLEVVNRFECKFGVL